MRIRILKKETKKKTIRGWAYKRGVEEEGCGEMGITGKPATNICEPSETQNLTLTFILISFLPKKCVPPHITPTFKKNYSVSKHYVCIN